jgi:hypothetical protein
MRHLTVLLLTAGWAAASATGLRGQTCPATLQKVFTAGDPVEPSGKIDRVHFEPKPGEASLGAGVSDHNLPWTPTIPEIKALQGVALNAVAVYKASSDPAISCRRDFGVTNPPPGPDGGVTPPPHLGGDVTAPPPPIVPPVTPPPAATDTGPTNPRTLLPAPGGSDCRAAGDVLSARIAQEQPGSDFTAVVFDAASQAVCYQSTDRPKFGGWIHVAVLTNDPIVWEAAKISFSPCSLQDSKLSLFAPESLPRGASLQAGTEYVLRRFQARRCYDPTVNITVESVRRSGNTNDPTITMRHELSQARRYHAALQVGVIFSNLHDHTFGLTRDRDTTRVYDKGAVRNGPEFTATILVYSLLNQVRGLLGGERYAGRELVADNSPLDRIGGVLGAGLNNPGDRFLAGLAYEAIPGINASVVWNVARVNRLVGIQPGTAFSGTEQQLPVQRQWRHDVAFGLSVDLTYATKLFGR